MGSGGEPLGSTMQRSPSVLLYSLIITIVQSRPQPTSNHPLLRWLYSVLYTSGWTSICLIGARLMLACCYDRRDEICRREQIKQLYILLLTYCVPLYYGKWLTLLFCPPSLLPTSSPKPTDDLPINIPVVAYLLRLKIETSLLYVPLLYEFVRLVP